VKGDRTLGLVRESESLRHVDFADRSVSFVGNAVLGVHSRHLRQALTPSPRRLCFPYLAWVSFAAILNTAINRLNSRTCP
jgi:hypothetical protein